MADTRAHPSRQATPGLKLLVKLENSVLHYAQFALLTLALSINQTPLPSSPPKTGQTLCRVGKCTNTICAANGVA